MNFVGHAAVAGWIDADPRWILGSMLPDLASMARARLKGADDPVAHAGIAFHHRTDDVFHGAPTFLALQTRGAEALEARGVGRGPARAVAHVGPELLIDGLLLDREEVRERYLDAVGRPPEPLGLRFAGDGAERFARLHARVRSHGTPDDYRSAAKVGERLVQILARRPRLALDPEDLPRIVPWLEQTRRGLSTDLPRLLEEVRRGLGLSGGGAVGPVTSDLG